MAIIGSNTSASRRTSGGPWKRRESAADYKSEAFTSPAGVQNAQGDGIVQIACTSLTSVDLFVRKSLSCELPELLVLNTARTHGPRIKVSFGEKASACFIILYWTIDKSVRTRTPVTV